VIAPVLLVANPLASCSLKFYVVGEYEAENGSVDRGGEDYSKLLSRKQTAPLRMVGVIAWCIGSFYVTVVPLYAISSS
jgi:hypothetical protein